MVSNCSKKYGNYHERKKMAILCCVRVLRAKTRAHVRVRDFFIKCLKWPETCANKIWDELEHFEILMRAYARVEVRTRILSTFFVDL